MGTMRLNSPFIPPALQPYQPWLELPDLHFLESILARNLDPPSR